VQTCALPISALRILAQPDFYTTLEKTTQDFVAKIRTFGAEQELEVKIFAVRSIFWFAFTNQEKVQRADQIDPSSMEKYKRMHRALLNRRVYFGPSGYDVGFVSAAHTQQDLDHTLSALKESLLIAFA